MYYESVTDFGLLIY